MTVRAILFDLFGTVVHFRPQVPTVTVAGTARRSTMSWLSAAAASIVPEIPFDDLIHALSLVTAEIIRQRPPEYLEVSSPKRFERALLTLGLTPSDAAQCALQLSLAHMDHIASMTFVPDGHLELLHDLRRTLGLGLVSNFDHGPTAHRILTETEVVECFESVLISDDFGRRKPHPAIFTECLKRLEVDARDALFVGDSVEDDVAGARNAGLRVVWIDEEGSGRAASTADFVVRRLAELPQVLDRLA